MNPKASQREKFIFLDYLLICSIGFFGGVAMVIAPVGLLLSLLFGVGLISVEFLTSAMLSSMLLSVFAGFWLAFKAGKETYEKRLLWRKIHNERD